MIHDKLEQVLRGAEQVLSNLGEELKKLKSFLVECLLLVMHYTSG